MNEVLARPVECARAAPQVEVQMKALEEAVGELELAAEEIDARLLLVLTAECRAETQLEPQKEMVPLAGQLCACTSGIVRVKNRLRGLIDRLEI